MDIFKEYNELKSNIEFKKFTRDNKDYYLAHIVVPDDGSALEIGFYNPKNDKIIVFKTKPFEKGKEEDVFKEGKTITKLDIDKIKINFDQAMEQINHLLQNQYSAEIPKKKIIILQHIQEPVWNTTIVCQSLNIINIRINTESGKIVRNDKSSLLNMAGVAK